MNFRWCAIVQTLVWPLRTIEAEVVAQPGLQVRYSGVVLEVDVLVLDTALQTFDKNVV